MEPWTLILTGRVGAAVIKLLDNVIQCGLARRAKKRMERPTRKPRMSSRNPINKRR